MPRTGTVLCNRSQDRVSVSQVLTARLTEKGDIVIRGDGLCSARGARNVCPRTIHLTPHGCSWRESEAVLERQLLRRSERANGPSEHQPFRRDGASEAVYLEQSMVHLYAASGRGAPPHSHCCVAACCVVGQNPPHGRHQWSEMELVHVSCLVKEQIRGHLNVQLPVLNGAVSLRWSGSDGRAAASPSSASCRARKVK